LLVKSMSVGSSLSIVRDVRVGSTLATSVVCLADRPFVARRATAVLEDQLVKESA
jgi:hypothetical protein